MVNRNFRICDNDSSQRVRIRTYAYIIDRCCSRWKIYECVSVNESHSIHSVETSLSSRWEEETKGENDKLCRKRIGYRPGWESWSCDVSKVFALSDARILVRRRGRNPRNFKFSSSNFTCLRPMFTGKFRFGIRLRFDSSQGIHGE